MQRYPKIIPMDELLVTISEKHLGRAIGKSAERSFYQRGKILIERIEFLCCLIGSNVKHHSEVVVSPSWKMYNSWRNIEKVTIEGKQRSFDLRKERSDFIEFQRNIEVVWNGTQHSKNTVEQTFKRALTIQARELTDLLLLRIELKYFSAELSSRMFVEYLKTEMRKKCSHTEMELFNRCLTSRYTVRCTKMSKICNVRSKAKTRCLNQLVKYDNDMGTLYACRMDLLKEMDFIEKVYAITQDQLFAQRNLYGGLKIEYEMHRRNDLLAKLMEFTRHRTAKVIQRYWKAYCARTSWKKRKTRLKIKCNRLQPYIDTYVRDILLHVIPGMRITYVHLYFTTIRFTQYMPRYSNITFNINYNSSCISILSNDQINLLITVRHRTGFPVYHLSTCSYYFIMSSFKFFI